MWHVWTLTQIVVMITTHTPEPAQRVQLLSENSKADMLAHRDTLPEKRICKKWEGGGGSKTGSHQEYIRFWNTHTKQVR